jgi:DNA invertase Pin-like site-specific DNA recombinase
MIKQHQQRTKIILDYIDNVIRVYHSSCEKAATEEARRRYRIFRAYFLDKEALPIDQIMEREHIKQRTVYRDIKKAIGKLACRIYTPRQHDQA